MEEVHHPYNNISSNNCYMYCKN